MLNDKQLVKIVKKGNRKNGRLYVYNVDGNYYFSDTYGIYKVNEHSHEKTVQEISKIFLGLPGEGESRGIMDKSATSNVPKIMDVFFDAEDKKFEHELKATNFLKEVKGLRSSLSTARILINGEFATLLNEEFFKTIGEGCKLKCNGRHDAICVFKEEEMLALILPLRVKEPGKLDKLIAAA
jgi:hypothetical protein